MTSDAQLARWRLRTQHLVEPHAGGADDVLRGLLAVQGEQPGPTSWAVAARTAARDPADLAALVERGAVLRTHVLRPTWHYVRAEDIGWLLELTAPRVQKVTGTQLRTTHGMTDTEIGRAVETIVAVVTERVSLTRPALAAELATRGIALTGQPLMLLLAHAELAGHLCSGPPSGGEHTYALLASRAPDTRRLARDEALAELALRYFGGHGPATERDLAYWATLPLGDVRRGLGAVRASLASFEHDGRTFWHAPGQEPPRRAGRPGAHLISLFDEIYRGYQDSRWVLDAAGLLARAREPSTTIGLVDGQLLAHVRRTLTPSTLRLEVTPYRPLTAAERRELERAAAAQAAFLGRELDLAR